MNAGRPIQPLAGSCQPGIASAPLTLPVARSTTGRKRATIRPSCSASVMSAAVTAARCSSPVRGAGSRWCAASSSPSRRAVSGFSIAPSSCRPYASASASTACTTLGSIALEMITALASSRSAT